MSGFIWGQPEGARKNTHFTSGLLPFCVWCGGVGRGTQCSPTADIEECHAHIPSGCLWNAPIRLSHTVHEVIISMLLFLPQNNPLNIHKIQRCIQLAVETCRSSKRLLVVVLNLCLLSLQVKILSRAPWRGRSSPRFLPATLRMWSGTPLTRMLLTWWVVSSIWWEQSAVIPKRN